MPWNGTYVRQKRKKRNSTVSTALRHILLLFTPFHYLFKFGWCGPSSLLCGNVFVAKTFFVSSCWCVAGGARVFIPPLLFFSPCHARKIRRQTLKIVCVFCRFPHSKNTVFTCRLELERGGRMLNREATYFSRRMLVLTGLHRKIIH